MAWGALGLDLAAEDLEDLVDVGDIGGLGGGRYAPRVQHLLIVYAARL